MHKDFSRTWSPVFILSLLALSAVPATPASALELNWSGQFRAQTNWVYNYSLGTGNTDFDTAKDAADGYYIPGGGSKNAFFQEAFLRLRPSVVVNDNIYIKSEWWVGDPVFGLFGNGAPYSADGHQFYSTGSRGSAITAQRFWAEFLTDVGTLQVGRAPLHWGLGVVWNAGNDVWDRYMSTGDVIRLVSKFGAFSVVPSAVLYSTGYNVGGACTTSACTTTGGEGSVRDYSLGLKYENPDQDVEMGINFVRRLGGGAQSAFKGPDGLTPGGLSYNTFDLYGRKKIGPVTLAAEVPITSGEVGSSAYSTFAAAVEANWKISDPFELAVRAGQAPGQPTFTGASPDTFKAFFFNPAYRVGMIMFNYQLASFAGPNTQNGPGAAGADTLKSPYDNPIVNANYLSLGASYALSKWKVRTQWVFASALEVAENGRKFYNTWKHKYVTANGDQDSSLGWEMSYGTTFQWDESFQFLFDIGWFFPGDYFRFSNVAGDANSNAVSPVFATTFKVGVNF